MPIIAWCVLNFLVLHWTLSITTINIISINIFVACRVHIILIVLHAQLWQYVFCHRYLSDYHNCRRIIPIHHIWWWRWWLQFDDFQKSLLLTLSKAYRVFWEMGNKCEKSHLSRWYWATAASYVSQQHNHKRSNQPMQHHTNTIIYKGCSENISHQLSLVYSNNFPKRFDLKRKSCSVHSR